MMDQEHLMLLARLKISLRKLQLGVVDLERYASDDDYARRVLEIAEEADDESLVILAVKLRHLRGLLAEIGSPSRAPAGVPAAFDGPRADVRPEAPAAASVRPAPGESPGAVPERFQRTSDKDGQDKPGGKPPSRYLFGARGG